MADPTDSGRIVRFPTPRTKLARAIAPRHEENKVVSLERVRQLEEAKAYNLPPGMTVKDFEGSGIWPVLPPKWFRDPSCIVRRISPPGRSIEVWIVDDPEQEPHLLAFCHNPSLGHRLIINTSFDLTTLPAVLADAEKQLREQQEWHDQQVEAAKAQSPPMPSTALPSSSGEEEPLG